MDAELTRLEAQIEQLATLCETLRTDNRALRTRAAKLEIDNRALSDKVQTATDAFQGLLDKLPRD